MVSSLNDKFQLNIFLYNFRILIYNLWETIQDGLTLTDLENMIFLFSFVNFIVVAIKYNMKSSLFITFTGLFAGFLWYFHFLNLLQNYSIILLKIPFFYKLVIDQLEISYFKYKTNNQLTDQNLKWYNLGRLVYYGVTKAITVQDPATEGIYYIDPISMIVSNLDEPTKSFIAPYYYWLYNSFIPTVLNVIKQYWNMISGVSFYVFVTRIGKKHCPYLIRWHWTFILIMRVVEPIYMSFVYRLDYFGSNILLPKLELALINKDAVAKTLSLQLFLLDRFAISMIMIHIGFVIFALLHAIFCQYFYVPFFVENTELHIGPRPKNNIYSGGYTSWQDIEEKEKKLKCLYIKFWYGWFGRGTDKNSIFSNIIIALIKRFKKIFKKILKKIKR